MSDIAEPYAEKSLDVTKDSPEGRYYTDHKFDHALMVYEKALEVGDAISTAVKNGKMGDAPKEGRVAFSADIDKETLAGAALCHDIGMSGGGYATTPKVDKNGDPIKDDQGYTVYKLDKQGNYVMHKEDDDNFSEIRTNQSLNSGLYVLVNRDEFKELDYSDEDIDKMALVCMVHSKSNSGVHDLNSIADWSAGFDRMDSLVAAWNADHKDNQISFDRTPFENSTEKLGILASETLALRVGDVSRDSGPEAEAQSGEAVHVDRDSINDMGGTIEKEVQDADITIGDKNEDVPSVKSRQVHVGEQNITENHTYVGTDYSIIHEITVADGCSAPECTQEAVTDHLGELNSAKDAEFTVIIKFEKLDNENLDYFKNSWDDFCSENEKIYTNLKITYQNT